MTLRIVISGWAAVFEGNDRITYPLVLRKLDGLVYDDECFTDHIGGTEFEDTLSASLERGGSLRFKYLPGSPLLRVTTEYRINRTPTPEELRFLASYTEGQWSDGIGDNFYQSGSEKRCGYSVACLCGHDFGEAEYPKVEIIPD